ncbi:MAG: aspartoacylase [Alphaproteobacteria bacterium]|jgi:aspartoacylase
MSNSLKQHHTIKEVVISAGTHGNEMSGIQAITQWQTNQLPLNAIAPTTNIQLALVNKPAVKARVRYIDEDLNRQFSFAKLNTPLSANAPNEAKVAHAFNAEFGPKGNAISDFCIDIHNTTSNMGPTLIVLENDEFHQQLARFVKSVMPESVILIEDYQPFEEFGYLCSVAKKGVMVEIGPQVQGALRAEVYQQTLDMSFAILRFIEHYNARTLPTLAPVEAFRLGTEIAYPTNAEKQKTALIHPNLEGKDFLPLLPQQACFIDFNGNDILWEGELTYPHFIGEAAYDHLNLAFATANKCMF